MNINKPEVSIVFHRDRFESDEELREIKGIVRAGLLDRRSTKHNGDNFTLVVQHNDMSAFLVNCSDLMSAEELSKLDTNLPLVKITIE